MRRTEIPRALFGFSCAFRQCGASRMFVRHGAARAVCKPKTLGHNRVACNDVKKD